MAPIGRQLLNNAGVGAGTDYAFPGGQTALVAEATFGGGSIKLQMKLPSGAYFDVPSMSLSAAGFVMTFLPPGTYRAFVTTATACSAWITTVPY